MAKKKADVAAAKAKKQKIILAVGGVMLLALGAIQGPKLLGGGSSAAPPPVAAAATPGTATAVPVSTPSGSTATAVKVSGPRPTAVLAGVTILGGAAPAVDPGHLVAFSLFETKDPFVQQGEDETTSADGSTTTSGTTSGTTETPAPTASGGTPGTTDAAPKPAPFAFATIMLDGKPQQLQKKQEFPARSPLFVLVSVKKKQAKIGVAGGAFDDGKTVTLVQGKKLTLVETATGVRYELKLVYTGSAPEEIKGFSSGNVDPAAAGSPPAPSVSSGTTTATATP